MSDTPRDTWENTPETDPAFIQNPDPYQPIPADWGSDERHSPEESPKGPTPFTVLSSTELLARNLPPKTNILGDGIITLGQLTTIIGQGGTGKSRVAMQIALFQVLGLKFGGFPTHDTPLRHLLIGTENSIYRQQSELRKMTASFSDEQLKILGENLFFHVVDQLEDAFINLGSDNIRAKWILTLEKIKPDCVYVDPFGEVTMGDINKDADVRNTLRELTKICRNHNNDTAIIIVHHARTGHKNIAQAVGYDKANFGLGSKALFSGTRFQINIAPGDPEDHSKIVFSCGKSNDSKPFAPIGLRLNDETMLYQVDESFDLNAWKDNVDGKSSSQTATIKDVILAIREGSTVFSTICNTVCDTTACSLSTAKRRLKDSIDKQYVRKTDSNTYILTDKSTNV